MNRVIIANQKIIDLQKKFCEDHKIPFFMPNDGHCFSCERDITERISEKKASSELITGCPFCCRSYVD